jgi:16S rRNA (guanine527-N7)-methyltransferase
MILVDSVKKKADFMQKLIKLLNLNEIEIVNDRIEDLGKDKYFRKTQNLILARAVAKISTLIEVSLPLLEIGGYCIFHKSNLSQSEFESMNKTLRYFDAQLIEIYKVSNELIARNHNLIIIKKNSEIDFEYPRNNNKPFRKPLF